MLNGSLVGQEVIVLLNGIANFINGDKLFTETVFDRIPEVKVVLFQNVKCRMVENAVRIFFFILRNLKRLVFYVYVKCLHRIRVLKFKAIKVALQYSKGGVLTVFGRYFNGWLEKL